MLKYCSYNSCDSLVFSSLLSLICFYDVFKAVVRKRLEMYNRCHHFRQWHSVQQAEYLIICCDFFIGNGILKTAANYYYISNSPIIVDTDTVMICLRYIVQPSHKPFFILTDTTLFLQE